MKAIIRNHPGFMDNWQAYDLVSYNSYIDLDEAKRREEHSPLHQVVKMIEDVDADEYKNYLKLHRTFREFK